LGEGAFRQCRRSAGYDIHAIQQPTAVWFRLCLVDLRKAIEPIQSNAPFTARDQYLDAVTPEELIVIIEELYAQA
jgi:hypothetical protein